MRVLIDECLPVQLRHWLQGHDVVTTQFLGWKGIKNGRLLAMAEGRFDVLVTSDHSMYRSYDIKGRQLAVVVVPTNRKKDVERMIDAIKQAIDAAKPGEYNEVHLSP